MVSRGCTKELEQVQLYCGTKSFAGAPKKRHTSGQYVIQCCTGDFCNNGTIPALPNVDFQGIFDPFIIFI